MSNNPTNYNAMSSKPKETTYEPTPETLVTNGNVVNDMPSYNVSEYTPAKGAGDPECTKTVVAPEPEPPKPKSSFGVVTNCARLNIRVKPDKNSDIVTVVDNGETVPIDMDKSTEDWYCVGSGYVMKEYVTIK